jgi:hypothetical protein
MLSGTDFPVDKGSCSYRVLWNAFKRIAAGCSAAERAALKGVAGNPMGSRFDADSQAIALH